MSEPAPWDGIDMDMVAAMEDNEYLAVLEIRVERAEAAVSRVRELHYQYRAAHINAYDICPECSRFDSMVGVPWPCATRRALDGDDGN